MKSWVFIWRCDKKGYIGKSLEEWIRSIPDPRCGRKTKHDHADILLCCILAFLAGKTSIRRAVSWCRRHEDKLKRYIGLAGGIPSASTISRIMAGIDIELLTLSFISWACGIVSPKGKHLAIDGKGLRASARKVMDETTPYILNVIDVTTKLVVAQIAIREKTNEMTAIPEVLELLEIKDSVITIDAIGTTNRIMDTVCGKGGHFVLQVKKNCPQLYGDIMMLFDVLENEKECLGKAFFERYGEAYSEWEDFEINRERHEYREARGCHDGNAIEVFREARPI